MNKTQLIDFVAEKANLTKKDAGDAIDAVFEGIASGLKNNQGAQFVGFGSFTITKTKARKGRNPRTGAEIDIPASDRIGFKAGKGLKELVSA